MTREQFETLLRERRHTIALTPSGPELTGYNVFEKLGVPGESGIPFDKIARWSVHQQFVRPGSGANVPQRRWRNHWVDPASVGIHGTYHSARLRKPTQRATRPTGSTQSRDASPIRLGMDDAAAAGALAAMTKPTSLAAKTKSTSGPPMPPRHHEPLRRPAPPSQKAATPRRADMRPSVPRAIPTSETSSEAGDDGGGGAPGVTSSKHAAFAGAHGGGGGGAAGEGNGESAAPATSVTEALAQDTAKAHTVAERAAATQAAERAAAGAARAAARRVAAMRGNPTLPSRVAGTTVVSAPHPPAAFATAPNAMHAGVAPASARPTSAMPVMMSARDSVEERIGSPRQGAEQLVKRAMLASAGGSLVVRYHTGRVVPAWFATPGGYTFDARVRPQSAAPAAAASGTPAADSDDPSPRGTLLAPSKRGPPRGSAPPSSRHLSIGFGEFGRTPMSVGSAARRRAMEAKKPVVKVVTAEFVSAKGEKLLKEVQALLD